MMNLKLTEYIRRIFFSLAVTQTAWTKLFEYSQQLYGRYSKPLEARAGTKIFFYLRDKGQEEGYNQQSFRREGSARRSNPLPFYAPVLIACEQALLFGQAKRASLARSRETHFTRPNRRACSQATVMTEKVPLSCTFY